MLNRKFRPITRGGPIAEEINRALATIAAQSQLRVASGARAIINTRFGQPELIARTPGVFSGARVYHNADQTVNGNTTVAFNSERYDTHVYHDNSTNNSRITIPTAGYYHVGCCISLGDGTDLEIDSRVAVAISLNGATLIAAKGEVVALASVEYFLNASCDYQFVAADYVEVIAAAYDSAGVANTTTLNATGNVSPEFWIHKLGDL